MADYKDLIQSSRFRGLLFTDLNKDAQDFRSEAIIVGEAPPFSLTNEFLGTDALLRAKAREERPAEEVVTVREQVQIPVAQTPTVPAGLGFFSASQQAQKEKEAARKLQEEAKKQEVSQAEVQNIPKNK